jgi:DNA-binding LacI/PurR family transcriptional regulator
VVTIELDGRVRYTATHFVGCNNRHGMKLIHVHVLADVDQDEQPVVFVGGSPESSLGRGRLAGFRRWFGKRPVPLALRPAAASKLRTKCSPGA